MNSDVHIFACIQNDTGLENSEWETWIRSEIGENLKSIEWFQNTAEWATIRDRALSHTGIPPQWKNYLATSGSMVEYQQLYLAYLKMSSQEAHDQQKYEFVVRSRTDTLFAKPIDFHWLQWSDEEVQSRLEKVKAHLDSSSEGQKDPKKILHFFMTTIFSDDLIKNIPNICYDPKYTVDQWVPNSASELNQFIRTGKYILTIRANNLYICNRQFFYLIPSLAFMFGHLHAPVCDEYWFNAENQFRSACYYSGLRAFDYNTWFEDQSVSAYNDENYFDEHGNLIHSEMLYCLVRR